jgi:hypothetical protein
MLNFCQLVDNGLAMNSTGANWRLLSATHIAKSFGFLFFFVPLKIKIQKILRTL